MVHQFIPDNLHLILGPIILIIAIPTALHFTGIINLKKIFKRKKQYGERYGHGL